MRLLILITSLCILSCGQNSSEKKKDIPVTDPVKITTDTPAPTKDPVKTPDTVVQAPSALATWINGILDARAGNKWHVLNDREAHWISGQFDYFIAPRRKGNPDYPYIAKGDFNGDGNTDLAAVVTDESKTQYQLSIILGADEKNPAMTAWKEDILEDAAISVESKSDIEGFEGEKTKKIKMKAEGINVEYFEKASFVIYWNGSVFKRIQTGD